MQRTIDIVPASLKQFAGLRFAINDQYQRAEHMAFTFANECLAGTNTGRFNSEAQHNDPTQPTGTRP